MMLTSKRPELYLFAALAFTFMVFHFFGYTQIFRFNEDIYYRQLINLGNVLDANFFHLVSPIYNLSIFADQLMPLSGPWSHTAAVVYFGVTILAFAGAVFVISGRDYLALTIALAVVFSAASITEASYWVGASHYTLSIAAFYLTYIAILKFERSQRDGFFFAACVLNAVAFTVSSLAFASSVLIAGYLLLLARLSRPRFVAALAALGCIVLYLAFRNFVLNDNIFAFATSYNQSGFRRWFVNAIEILDYSHPLGLLARSLPQLYVTMSTTSPWAFLHLAPITAIAAYAFWHYRWQLFPLLLYSAGITITLLNASGLAQRHFLPLTLVSGFVLGLAVTRWVSVRAPACRWAAVLFVAAVVVLNFAMKTRTEIANWWKFFGAERGMFETAQAMPQATEQLVFIPHEAFVLRGSIRQWTGNYYATTAGVRRLLADAGNPACVYKGYVAGEADASEIREWGLHNSAEWMAKYSQARPVSRIYADHCPVIPPPAQTARCFEFHAGDGLRGRYWPYAGRVAVPVCSDFRSETDPRTCLDYVVDCR